MQKTKTLSFKLIILFLIFLLLVLGSCGVITYLNQMAIYRSQCETDVRNVSEYLEDLIALDGEDFARYQAYFLEHFTEVDVPVDAQEYQTAQAEFRRRFQAAYPGKTLGVDVAFDEMDDGIKHAYLVYKHLNWLLTFERAARAFDLSYAYYLVPHSEKDTITYMIDGVRTSRAEHIEFIAEYPDYAEYDHYQGDEAEYLYLGEEVTNDRQKFAVEWAAWEGDGRQTGFQVWHNEFGNTYAYYTPLVVGGQKLGLIGTEVDIEAVNTAILHNTLRQFLVIGLILVLSMCLLVLFIHRRYIRRIAELEAHVHNFAQSKDASVAEAIRGGIRGKDEVATLSEGVAQMIEEIRDYVDTLVKARRALDKANTNAARLSELALRDGLTGIRNRTAYEQEVDRLSEDTPELSIAMIDLNDLKRINDTYGHEHGNAAIIRLSAMVCENFKHSMVFRIGGDEFVAILLNEDHRDRDVLVARLQSALEARKRDESLPPWERISAAVGLATYDPQTDTRIEDTFRRADARMYARKKEMKGDLGSRQ